MFSWLPDLTPSLTEALWEPLKARQPDDPQYLEMAIGERAYNKAYSKAPPILGHNPQRGSSGLPGGRAEEPFEGSEEDDEDDEDDEDESTGSLVSADEYIAAMPEEFQAEYEQAAAAGRPAHPVVEVVGEEELEAEEEDGRAGRGAASEEDEEFDEEAEAYEEAMNAEEEQEGERKRRTESGPSVANAAVL